MVFVSSDANFRVQSFVLCRRGFQMTHQSTHARRRRRDDDDASKTTIPPPPPNAPFRNPEDDFVGVDGLDHHRRHPTRVLSGVGKRENEGKNQKGKNVKNVKSFARIAVFSFRRPWRRTIFLRVFEGLSRRRRRRTRRS